MKKLNLNQIFQPIEKMANARMEEKRTAQEWGFIIVMLLSVKLITQYYSALGAYNFFMQVIFAYIESMPLKQFFTITSLVMIEIIVAGFMFRFFKFILAEGWDSAAKYTLVALIVVYGFSMYTSIAGINLKKVSSADASPRIEAEYFEAKKALQNDLNMVLAEKDLLIENERNNPQGWSGYRRTHLTQDQNIRVSYAIAAKDSARAIFDAKINTLEDKHSVNLALNADKMKSTKTGSTWIMVAVLTAQLIVSFLISFFLRKIYEENKPDKVIKESSARLISRAMNYSENLLMQSFEKKINEFEFAIKAAYEARPTLKDITAGTAKEETAKTQTNVAGVFARNNDNSNENRKSGPNDIRNENRNDNRWTGSGDKRESPETDGDGFAVCEHCGNKYIKNHKKQRFCSESCKLAAWEQANNKTLFPHIHQLSMFDK